MLIKLYEENTNARVVQKIANALREGGLIIYPTDTIYAIGCDIFHARAVEQICKIKGESPAKANLSFICSDLSQISAYAKISNPVFKLIKRNTPGPFTFILNGTNALPKLYKPNKTIGIRIPDNGIVSAIVEELGNPLMTTSLKNYENLWDEGEEEVEGAAEYMTDPELIEERYGRFVDMIIDGGQGGVQPSTVVDCTGDEPVVLRQGIGELEYV